MSVEIINPLNYSSWDEQVLRRPGCSFFHSSAWARVLCESYGYAPLYFTILEGNALSACLPVMEIDSLLTGRRGVSLPFTDFCEPLVSDAGQFGELFEAATEYGKNRGWKYLEMRGGTPSIDGALPYSTYLAHTLDLAVPSPVSLTCNLQPVTCNTPSPPVPSPVSLTRNLQPVTCNSLSRSAISQLVFSRFRDSTRRNIKKAKESGVRVEILTTKEGLREFCRLNQGTRREHGLPPQPWRFFEQVHEHVISKGYGFVAVAFHADAAVAASVYFYFGSAAVYKYGASDKQYQHLRANNLVMSEAIQWLIDKGFADLSFGRTDLDHSGLRQFKTGWGTREQPISYYRYGIKSNAFVSNGSRAPQVHTKLFRRMPGPVLNFIGSVLYKHMG